MKLLNLWIQLKDGGSQFEGVFDSIKELADYLEVPKTTVTHIINADYNLIHAKYHKYSINQVFSAEGHAADIASLKKGDDV